MCRDCGHYSQNKLRGLGGECPGPLPHRDDQTPAEKKRECYRSRLLRNLHPLTKEALP